jgi:hypothetical protein
MKKVIRLTESDLARIIRRVIKESDEFDWKWDKMQDQINNYDTGFVDLRTLTPGERSIKYTVRKIDDCERNNAFYDNSSKTALIEYCNYDGERSVEELDEKGDDMWMRLKRKMEKEYDNEFESRGMYNRWRR